MKAFRLLVIVYLSGILHSAEAVASAPNIIVILADDVGWGDAGCYGATKVKTTHIDLLAREGRRFENGYASASVCTPTRYSMITGQYSWRRVAEGLNKGVSNGESPLLIPTTMVTGPGLLQQAGYRTALIGKWHLGFGESKPDYNQELRPGPLEVGFTEFFGLPATNDRFPTVLVRDHRVQGLDPADPIQLSYNEAKAKSLGLSSWAAGRGRIGWGNGGKSAWWKDTELADTLLRESIAFIERNKDRKFCLYYMPHNVHAPAIPGTKFAGSSGMGGRADMLLELDACIGQLLQTLDRLNLAKDTMIIYSSDNGAYVNDEQGHKPTGPFRGKKSQSWEGGYRVPFVVRWPARIQPGISDELASTLDIPATICSAAGVNLPQAALPDSFDLIPAMIEQPDAFKRDHLVLMSGTGELALRSDNLKYIPNIAAADGWYGGAKKGAGSESAPGLFNVKQDPGETKNLAADQPNTVKRLGEVLAKARSEAITRPQSK